MGAEASHSTQDKAHEILGNCPQWLLYYWRLSCLCHVTLSTVETLQRQNEMRPLLFCLQAPLTVFRAEVNSAAQALPRSRVSQGCRDAHGDRTYSQHWRMGYSSVEDGDVAGNHSASSSGGCSYIRGGGTVGQGTAFGLLHVGICMVRGSQVFSAGYGARMQRGVILF